MESLSETINYLVDYYQHLLVQGLRTQLFNDIRIISADRALFFQCFEQFVLAFNGTINGRGNYAMSVFEKIAQKYEQNQISLHELYLYLGQTAAQLPPSEIEINDLSARLQGIEADTEGAAHQEIMLYPKGMTGLM